MGARSVRTLCGALFMQLLLVSVSGSAHIGSGDDSAMVRLHAGSRSMSVCQQPDTFKHSLLASPLPWPPPLPRLACPPCRKHL